MQQSVAEISANATVTLQVVGDTVESTIEVPASDFAILGLIPGFDMTVLHISSTHAVIL